MRYRWGGWKTKPDEGRPPAQRKNGGGAGMRPPISPTKKHGPSPTIAPPGRRGGGGRSVLAGGPVLYRPQQAPHFYGVGAALLWRRLGPTGGLLGFWPGGGDAPRPNRDKNILRRGGGDCGRPSTQFWGLAGPRASTVPLLVSAWWMKRGVQVTVASLVSVGYGARFTAVLFPLPWAAPREAYYLFLTSFVPPRESRHRLHLRPLGAFRQSLEDLPNMLRIDRELTGSVRLISRTGMLFSSYFGELTTTPGCGRETVKHTEGRGLKRTPQHAPHR